MAKKRTIVLFSPSTSGGLEPLGTLDDVLTITGRCNLTADGSGPAGLGVVPGMVILHGPGFIAEVPSDGDRRSEINQIMTTVTDEDFAWPVLRKLCRLQGWKMMDPDSGRTFG